MTSDKSKFLAKFGHEGHLKTAINSPDRDTFEHAAKNPSLDKDNIDKLVNSTIAYRRTAVANNPNLSKDHLDKLVHDPEKDVRMNIGENPNLSKKHLDTLVKDKSDWVIASTQHNKNLTRDQAKTAYDRLKEIPSILHYAFANTVKQKHGYDV